MSGVKNEFKRNLKLLIKAKGYKSNDEFGAAVGMSGGKIQRLCDIYNDGSVDLNDAYFIAEALDSTLGYMCGSPFTEYMLSQTKMMHAHFEEMEEWRASYVMSLTDKEKPMRKYLEEIINSVDALNRPQKS
mgnify:FL=1|tara:strand:- start:1207 stop:1599 length:393 start_codon:yes stop_codon:yes gene_type:complete